MLLMQARAYITLLEAEFPRIKNSNINVNMVVVRLIAKNIGTLDIFRPGQINSSSKTTM